MSEAHWLQRMVRLIFSFCALDNRNRLRFLVAMTHETPYGKATVKWTTIRGWTIYLGRTKIIGRELPNVPTTEQVIDEVTAYMNAMKKHDESKRNVS